MQAASFDGRCRRVTRGIVLLAAAAGIFAAPSAMAQVMVSHIPPITIFSGDAGVIHLSSADPVVPIVFTVLQTGAPALLGLTVTSTGPSTADVTFTAPVLPLGQVTSDVVGLTPIDREARHRCAQGKRSSRM